MENQYQKNFKPGDEVCILHNMSGNLVFGTLEHPIVSVNPKPLLNHTGRAPESSGGNSSAAGSSQSTEKSKKEAIWKVRWIHDPNLTVSDDVPLKDLMPTDRGVYKGCKVRSVKGADGIVKEGICRAVFYVADLRIVGTNTIISKVNIKEFSHLKEFKQKSVVHYKGWLGVISDVQRIAEIRQDNQESKEKLERISPKCPFGRESPWINEQCYPFRTSCLPNTNTDDTIIKRAKRIAFIKNLQVESVKVAWYHQIDASFPDKPKMEFKHGTHCDLALVKEDVSTDDSEFTFEVGNLGRYKITNQTEFVRWDVWQKNFAITNLKMYNPKVPDLIKMNSLVGEEKSSDVRAYNQAAYDQNNEASRKMSDIDKSLVVEIVHVQSTADVKWQDGTSDIISSLELEIVETEMLHSNNCFVPGDFIYSRQLNYKPEDAYFVLINEKVESGVKKLIVKVLDANSPGKVLRPTAELDPNPKSRMDKVERHPIYQYFNESTTIVVKNEYGGDEDSRTESSGNIRIGYVTGTNLGGKVAVRFNDSRSGSEEWIWPQECAIYSVKGFDLECAKSHVADNENEADPENKLRTVMESLKNKVELVWKNDSKTENDLKESLRDFGNLVNSFENAVSRVSRNLPEIQFDRSVYEELVTYLKRSIGIDADERPSFFKNEPQVTALVINACRDLQSQGQNIINELMALSGDTIGNEVDRNDADDAHSTIAARDSDLEIMFSKTVDVLETCPEFHHYAKSTKFAPQHHKCFVKVVKDELDRLEKMCSTEMQSQMGIMIRAFTDRMDLLSIIIRGPVGTPYEDSLYLFDACLPPNYPNVAPQFHFHSFGAGRLNPNLYAEGKVCVSLLGTWSGRDEREKWTKDSNIVQVLISIQGLILVKDPYHNEPGQEANVYKPAVAEAHNLKYNTTLMPLVVNMMMNQLKMNADPWKNEVRLFYKNQIPVFIARWRKWLSVKSEKMLAEGEKPGFIIYPMTDEFVRKMNSQLDLLETTWKTL